MNSLDSDGISHKSEADLLNCSHANNANSYTENNLTSMTKDESENTFEACGNSDQIDQRNYGIKDEDKDKVNGANSEMFCKKNESSKENEDLTHEEKSLHVLKNDSTRMQAHSDDVTERKFQKLLKIYEKCEKLKKEQLIRKKKKKLKREINKLKI